MVEQKYRKYSFTSSAKYGVPAGVTPGVHLTRPTLSTSQGGRVAVDRLVIALWEFAIGRSPEEIQQLFPAVASTRVPGFEIQSWEIRAALVCLETAGLLSYSTRKYSSAIQEGKILYPTGSTLLQNQPPPSLREVTDKKVGKAELPEVFLRNFKPAIDDTSGLVSVIIVAYNSLEWLPDCFHSLACQSYAPMEIILVDNGSSDEATTWFSSQFSNRFSSHFLESTLIRFEMPVPLSAAINAGIKAAKGFYFFVLNPDTQLEPDTVSNLVKCLEQNPEAAAVAAKLKLLWTPGFLNGLGNFIGAISWGTDCCLGHLDLGQFDHWKEVPSACFAGALIRSSIWQAVGPLDENLPMYYEDSEWCYRARLFGYKILVAPEAVIFHALGSRIPGTQAETLSPSRLERVVFGRLHFISRLFRPLAWLRFFSGYLFEDLARSFLALLRGQRLTTQAYARGWRHYLTSIPQTLVDRRMIQPRRIITDHQLLFQQKEIPPVMVWHGLPLLTWEVIQGDYAPLILGDQVKSHIDSGKSEELFRKDPSWKYASTNPVQPNFLKRMRKVYRIEGYRALMERLGRIIQHRLRRP